MPRRSHVLAPLAAAAMAAVALPIIASGAPGEELPDLRADPPANALAPSVSDGRLLLRFDGYVTNVGPGPLDVTGNPQTAVYQRVRTGSTFADDHEVPVQFEYADGHNHFHLMRIMRYSLRTSSGAEVAPGQKVGFCLYDYSYAQPFSGTRAPQVYGVGRAGDTFCASGNPGATYLNMGIGTGWRDDYRSYLPFQWVDISDTTPGTYYLAAEADPNDIIRETVEQNPIAVSSSAVTVPGYVPRAIGPVAASGSGVTTIPLAATKYGSANPVTYSIVSQPSRGSVAIQGGNAVYTPAPGAAGTFTFTYSAAQSNNAFPRTKRTATVTLQVGAAAAAAVSISGAPVSLMAGTSAQLSATVVNAAQGVTWTTTGGTISPTGVLVAPASVPAGGTITVRATSNAAPATFAEVTIPVHPAPVPRPASLPSGSGAGAPGVGGVAKPAGDDRLYQGTRITRHRRTIVVRATAMAGGRSSIAAIRGGKVVARCTINRKTAGRITCKLVVPKRFARTPVRVVLGLRTTEGVRYTARLLSRR